MEDYRPNSNRFKESKRNEISKNDVPQKKVEKVITGTARVKKKSKIDGFMSNFISEDAKSVKSYVFGEVLIPAIKKAISDIVTDGIDIILYGESRKGSRRSNAGNVSYRSYYDDRRPRMNERQALTTPGCFCDEIILDRRGDAEDVLARLDEIMDTYGLVRVSDLYELVGMSCDFTYNNYGWTNIVNATIQRTRDGGYAIKMPRAIPID